MIERRHPIESLDVGLEVPEADAIEQNQPVVAEAAEGDSGTSPPMGVPEGDWLEQLHDVPGEDDIVTDDIPAEDQRD